MDANDVLKRLDEHLLVDGYDLVLDLDASRGSRLVDARDGEAYLDMFTFFASNALGMNHPVFAQEGPANRTILPSGNSSRRSLLITL